MHVFLNFSRAKVVGQTSWLAHWEQKVGGQLPALPNRLRRQWLWQWFRAAMLSHTCSYYYSGVTRVGDTRGGN